VPSVDAVKVEVHVAEAVVPVKVHVVNDPVTPETDIETVPVGVINPPAEVSVTVTLQDVPWLRCTGVAQLTVVLVALRLTTILVVPPLIACEASPG